MLGFFSGIIIIFSFVILFASPFFIFAYILMSLKNKDLQKDTIIKYSKYILIGIGLSILIIAFAAITASDPPDEGGLIVILIIFGILIEFIYLFVLWLFYSVYYIFVNKNNSEVDNKKPIKIFMIICLFLIPIIVFLF